MVRRLKERAVRALRWSEQYLKTDMVYLASGGFWSALGQGVAALSSLALAMVVSRYLPKEVYGEYKYILSLVALLGVFSLNGMAGSVFRSVAHGFNGALREGFHRNLQWSALLFFAAFGIALYYLYAGNPTLALGMLIGGCFSPFLSSANLTQSFLLAKKDFARATLYFDVAANLIPVTSLIAAILLRSNTVVLVAVYFTSNTLVALYLYRRANAAYDTVHGQTDPSMHSYGKHLSVMGIVGTIAGSLDQILVFHFVGAAELAVYNYAIAVPDQIKGPLKTLDSMVQARFAHRTDAEIRRGMPRKILVLGLFYAVIMLFYMAVAHYLFAILFPAYIDAVPYSRIYALSMLIFPLDIASSYLSVKRKVREQYIATTATAFFKIAAMGAGVVWWGLTGLIIALVFARVFSVCISYVLYEFSSRTPEI